MKTLQECKDQWAQEREHENFESYLWHIADSEDGVQILDQAFDEVSKLYATQVAEQALKDASERATASVYYHPEDRGEPDAEVDRDSILSTPIVTP